MRIGGVLFRLIIAVSSVAGIARAHADEYDVTITFNDTTPVHVPFLRCARNSDVLPTNESPADCRVRDADSRFKVSAVRITNIGESVVWLHIGQAKLPVPPGKFFRRTRPKGALFDRVFLSGSPGGVAHVFASDPVQDEPR